MELDKNKKLAIFITLAAIIILIGITFTFFSSTVSNANKEKINTQTATLSLVFDDNDNGVSGTLNLGESIVKRFTIENTGTEDAYGKINWVDLVNTYMDGSLSWTLESSTSENGTYTTIKSGYVPTSSSATTAVLKDGLLVPEGDTIYYKLTITLNNLDIDQSSDINANMHSKFNLVAGAEPLTAVQQIKNIVTGSPTNSIATITATAPEGESCTNTLAYDGSSDNNLRYVLSYTESYVESGPCNYAIINGVEARIVGVMNNVINESGKSESRLKVVFPEALSETTWGQTNNFNDSLLKNKLNDVLINKTCMNSVVGDATWYTRGMPSNNNSIRAIDLYDVEKTSGSVYPGYPTQVVASYAPLNVSDIVLSEGDFFDEKRQTKLNEILDFNEYFVSAYFFPLGRFYWTLNSFPSTNNQVILYYSEDMTFLNNSEDYQVNMNYWYLPSAYLKSDVEITSGDGSSENPYIIGDDDCNL